MLVKQPLELSLDQIDGEQRRKLVEWCTLYTKDELKRTLDERKSCCFFFHEVREPVIGVYTCKQRKLGICARDSLSYAFRSFYSCLIYFFLLFSVLPFTWLFLFTFVIHSFRFLSLWHPNALILRLPQGNECSHLSCQYLKPAILFLISKTPCIRHNKRKREKKRGREREIGSVSP